MIDSDVYVYEKRTKLVTADLSERKKWSAIRSEALDARIKAKPRNPSFQRIKGQAGSVLRLSRSFDRRQPHLWGLLTIGTSASNHQLSGRIIRSLLCRSLKNVLRRFGIDVEGSPHASQNHGLFVTESGHGIDLGGAIGRNVAGQHGHGNQADSHHRKGRRIGGGHAKQKSGDKARETSGKAIPMTTPMTASFRNPIR